MRPRYGASAALLLSLIGLGLSAYLYYIHLGLLRGEFLGGAVCSGTGAFNCHAVTSGRWGSFLGMPLALWGCLSYAVMIGLALLAFQSEDWAARAISLIFVLASAMVAVDIGLFIVMAAVIRLYCAFCLMTYAVNVAILGFAVAALGRPWPGVFSSLHVPRVPLFWGLVLTAAAGVVGTHLTSLFIMEGAPGALRQQLEEYVSKQPVRGMVVLDHDPIHGPASAPVQMVEFSDFLCPACQRASKMIPILLASHRNDIVFAFKNYPLDTACNSNVQRNVHPGSCQVAAAGECANQQGKFWTFHDFVFEKGHDYNVQNLNQDIVILGLDAAAFRACMESGQGMDAVKRDIAEAAKWQIMSTPTFIINGTPVTGGLNPSVFEEFLSMIRRRDRGA